ncbi:MAG: hypothetical protein COV55_01790 [Candidatus Komeilibacteria bacterium CG11_big_fil_rev_8_21_14_0_20_36_20]|uniref:Uncharacterized protein n=1 Tax=Candidatus Komeilibacteria bacterium CG11_big_fil_rev_8_21_14_0_20_36_20 TaxID=1974477 RepID=A0A2H0NE18_9BACT|nr:MAG: hypothetical protein COV55_01790 [Candidatus Komeilibacteria bacterium CG11_big_fil_rev_8_21_14_0_20_36_20]PIR81275.1 MAG: hypothetical protein COU21_04775 [Candidatus Komeilibacteria bacterium CG10_big_fil_rev_8_21_14_0_10_36_65]PJC55239.1 MAG: hypothetical protein CO027_03715 [Candidatus Komeilibacteria bacterium CG_4_9_14_0_2_um_filter_36_13]
MSNQPIIPQQPKNYKKDSQRNNWTLSYRIKGLTIGLLGAIFYCYFYAHDWSKLAIISAGVVGYFLGWVVGIFFYTDKD